MKIDANVKNNSERKNQDQPKIQQDILSQATSATHGIITGDSKSDNSVDVDGFLEQSAISPVEVNNNKVATATTTVDAGGAIEITTKSVDQNIVLTDQNKQINNDPELSDFLRTINATIQSIIKESSLKSAAIMKKILSLKTWLSEIKGNNKAK